MHDPKFKTQILKENSERLAVDGTSIPSIVDYFLQQIDTVSAKLFELGKNPDYEQPFEKSILYKGKAAGIYLYQIQAGEYISTKKMVLLK